MTTPRILIVDDDPDTLQTLPKMLQLYIDGVVVDTFDSATEALARILAVDYDAIVSDFRMPGMNGLALLAEVQARRPGTPTILISAYGERDLVTEALRRGAYDFIEKPVELDYFVAAIGRAIQMRRLARQVAEQTAALARHADELEQTVAARTRELLASNAAKNEFLAARDRALAAAEAAQSRLEFLAEASQRLSASLDYGTILEQVARLGVPYLADYCILDAVEPDGSLRLVAVSHVEPAQEALVREGHDRYPPLGRDWYPTVRALRTGEAELYPEVTDAMLVAAAVDEENLRLLRTLAPRACMIVPLVARGRTVGILTFVTAGSGRRYSAETLALAQDLAGRAALAVDNARLYREAQEALHIRDEFLSIAAHELRTPLTGILASVQLLQRRSTHGSAGAARDERTMRVLIDQTRRLHRLIGSLLDLSRLQTGQLTIERAPLDVLLLVRRVIDELQPTLDHHTVYFSAPPGPLPVEGDELRLEQVLQNILQNAIKYSPGGGAVHVQVACEGAQVTISIADEGIGIPAAAQARLFTRFYRVDSPAAQQIGGLGLGLYIVREIVTLHGGHVAVESTEGQGSTFTVCLPLLSPASA